MSLRGESLVTISPCDTDYFAPCVLITPPCAHTHSHTHRLQHRGSKERRVAFLLRDKKRCAPQPPRLFFVCSCLNNYFPPFHHFDAARNLPKHFFYSAGVGGMVFIFIVWAEPKRSLKKDIAGKTQIKVFDSRKWNMCGVQVLIGFNVTWQRPQTRAFHKVCNRLDTCAKRLAWPSNSQGPCWQCNIILFM